MFGKRLVTNMIERSAETPNDRRRFLRNAGLAGLGTIGATSLAGMGSASAAGPSDASILNFALNLEYLEAEFYSWAAFGHGLDPADTTGTGRYGLVTGGKKVDFDTKAIKNYATEIAWDEIGHVKFLRAALGSAKVSRPGINIQEAFNTAAHAAGLAQGNDVFDPYANEDNFLLAAFIFEDVGVTAYKGAAPLIDNKAYLDAAAGILSVEAYHAGIVRTSLYSKELYDQARAISGARDSLDGPTDDDRGIGTEDVSNLVPADKNSITYSRSPKQVLNIVYLTDKVAKKGGFFPHGTNGSINYSGDNEQK